MVTPIFRIDGLPVARLVALAFVLLKIAHDVAFPFEPLRITSAVRTRDEQIAIFTRRYRRGGFSPWGDYRKYQGVWWGRISAEGPVASPDAVSNHTRGYALDLNIAKGTARQAWMIANAPRFGFHWTEGKSVGEAWHWTWAVTGIFPTALTPNPWGPGGVAPTFIDSSDFGLGDYAAAVRVASGGASASVEDTKPKTRKRKRDDMVTLLRRESTKAAYVIAPGRYIKHVPNKDEEKLVVYAEETEFRDCSDEHLGKLLWSYGFPELSGRMDKLPLASKTKAGFYWSPGPSGKGTYS